MHKERKRRKGHFVQWLSFNEFSIWLMTKMHHRIYTNISTHSHTCTERRATSTTTRIRITEKLTEKNNNRKTKNMRAFDHIYIGPWWLNKEKKWMERQRETAKTHTHTDTHGKKHTSCKQQITERNQQGNTAITKQKETQDETAERKDVSLRTRCIVHIFI